VQIARIANRVLFMAPLPEPLGRADRYCRRSARRRRGDFREKESAILPAQELRARRLRF
jgi:hypothetical protein